MFFFYPMLTCPENPEFHPWLSCGFWVKLLKTLREASVLQEALCLLRSALWVIVLSDWSLDSMRAAGWCEACEGPCRQSSCEPAGGGSGCRKLAAPVSDQRTRECRPHQPSALNPRRLVRAVAQRAETGAGQQWAVFFLTLRSLWMPRSPYLWPLSELQRLTLFGCRFMIWFMIMIFF